MDKEQLKHVHFLPWVGKDYENGGTFGKRILVLGESHYNCNEGCTREQCENALDCNKHFTSDVVKGHLYPELLDKENDNKWRNTYTKFERSLIGEWTDEEGREEVWESIAFYNFLQYAVQGPRQAGEDDSYAKAVEAFFEVLNALKPELLIVWGQRLWDSLPGDSRWEAGSPITIDGYEVQNGFYKLNDGSSVRAFPVYHPSAGYSWEYWHKVIKAFI